MIVLTAAEVENIKRLQCLNTEFKKAKRQLQDYIKNIANIKSASDFSYIKPSNKNKIDTADKFVKLDELNENIHNIFTETKKCKKVLKEMIKKYDLDDLIASVLEMFFIFDFSIKEIASTKDIKNKVLTEFITGLSRGEIGELERYSR